MAAQSPREELEDALLRAFRLALPAGIGWAECREVAELALRVSWANYRAGLVAAWADDPDPE